jgi:hypothetical protein
VQDPENRDELQLELDNTIPVRFIPIFGAHIKNIYGHTKKDIPMFHAKKDISILFPYSVSQEDLPAKLLVTYF